MPTAADGSGHVHTWTGWQFCPELGQHVWDCRDCGDLEADLPQPAEHAGAGDETPPSARPNTTPAERAARRRGAAGHALAAAVAA